MAIKHSAEDYIRSKNWDYREHGNEFWLDCPACGEGMKDGSFAINTDTGAWNCKRATCTGISGWNGGSLYRLKALMGDVKETTPTTKSSGPNGNVKQVAPKSYSAPKPVERTQDETVAHEAAEWLKSRGLDLAVVKQFKIQPILFGDKQEPTIAFPYYRNGVHIHTKYRLRDGKKAPWKNFRAESDCRRCLYGADLIPATATELIIVEGELDAVAMKQLGFPAVSLPDGIDSINEFIAEEFDWLKRFKTIYLAVDMDVPDQKLQTLARRLGQDRCKRVSLPFKDPNECLAMGWGHEDVQEALNGSYDVKPKQLKSTDDFARAYGESRFSEGSEEKNTGTPWHLPGLNDYLLGKRPGSMTFWPGFNFAGKTTAMLQEMGDDLKSGVKCLFLCLEISAFEALDWILQQQLGRPLRLITVDHFCDALFDFLKNLWWVEPSGKLTEDDMYDAIRYAVLRYGVEQIYIDNLTCVGFRKDDFNAQAEFARKVKFEVARELGVHVHVITHTRKAQSMKNVSGDRNDIAGAKELSDLSDNVIIIRRNEEKDEEKAKNQPTTFIDIDKNRFGKKQGVIQLKYDDYTNRFGPYFGLPMKQHQDERKAFYR